MNGSTAASPRQDNFATGDERSLVRLAPSLVTSRRPHRCRPEDQEETTIETAQDLLVEARHYAATFRNEGDGFERSYYEALQRTPDVVLAHASVKKLLSTATTDASAAAA